MIGAGARKCKMKHAVKYGAYFDILLKVSIYVIEYELVKKWISNSTWDIWTQPYFGPGTRDPGPVDLGS